MSGELHQRNVAPFPKVAALWWWTRYIPQLLVWAQIVVAVNLCKDIICSSNTQVDPPHHFPNDTIGRETRFSQHVQVCENHAAVFLVWCVDYWGGLTNNRATKGKSWRKTCAPPCWRQTCHTWPPPQPHTHTHSPLLLLGLFGVQPRSVLGCFLMREQTQSAARATASALSLWLDEGHFYLSVYTLFSSCLLANMCCGPVSHRPMVGPEAQLAQRSAGAGVARKRDKESMLTDLPINLKHWLRQLMQGWGLAGQTVQRCMKLM